MTQRTPAISSDAKKAPAWRTPRVGPDGKPAVDPGGPCPNCVPVDQAQLQRHLDTLTGLMKFAPDDATRGKLAQLATAIIPDCVVCSGKGFVHVCPACDGHAVSEKHLVKAIVGEVYEEEEEYIAEPEVQAPGGRGVLRKAVMAKRTVKKLREVERDSWKDGPTCTTCKGHGLEGIAKEQVGTFG